ncbi:MAG: hypothetical protein ACK4KW_11510 [Gemmobacter sp.]
MRLAALVILLATLSAGSGAAQGALSGEIAERGLRPVAERLAALSDLSADERFALAGLRFLGAVEGALQTRWRHGLGDAGTQLPVLRLPIPQNPAPEPFTGAVMTALLSDLRADLAEAGAALTGMPADDFGLAIRLGDLWFDIDGNGRRGPGEGLVEVAGLTVLGRDVARMRQSPVADAVIRFDAADAFWLAAYAEFLQGLSTLALAFDPGPAIDLVLDSKVAFMDLRGTAPMPSALDMMLGRQADALAMLWLTLHRQPDPALTRQARQHLLAMIALNRRFWDAVAAESDDEAEWIPNDRQTAALGFRLPPGTGPRWLAVLDEAEGLLTGRLLMPHWRYGAEAGVNLARLFDDPAPVDPMGWFQGHGLLRWAEKGTRASPESWREFERMLYGDAVLFALLLN